MSTKLIVAGANARCSLFALILIAFFMTVSSLKVSQNSDNLSIKFAIVAKNIDNSSMAIAAFHFFIAHFQCELHPGSYSAFKQKTI